jgi:hypothetical protein
MASDLASAYVGLGETNFLAGVKRGDWPEALKLGKRRLWDRVMLDEAVDRHSGRNALAAGREWMESLNDTP